MLSGFQTVYQRHQQIYNPLVIVIPGLMGILTPHLITQLPIQLVMLQDVIQLLP